jgi:DNA-binding transcriptional ArsR family regulator
MSRSTSATVNARWPGTSTDLGAPRSTTELAERLTLSPATASHHLAALRDAGLVTGRREGRAVLYVRTPLGDALAAT